MRKENPYPDDVVFVYDSNYLYGEQPYRSFVQMINCLKSNSMYIDSASCDECKKIWYPNEFDFEKEYDIDRLIDGLKLVSFPIVNEDLKRTYGNRIGKINDKYNSLYENEYIKKLLIVKFKNAKFNREKIKVDDLSDKAKQYLKDYLKSLPFEELKELSVREKKELIHSCFANYESYLDYGMLASALESVINLNERAKLTNHITFDDVINTGKLIRNANAYKKVNAEEKTNKKRIIKGVKRVDASTKYAAQSMTFAAMSEFKTRFKYEPIMLGYSFYMLNYVKEVIRENHILPDTFDYSKVHPKGLKAEHKYSEEDLIKEKIKLEKAKTRVFNSKDEISKKEDEALLDNLTDEEKQELQKQIQEDKQLNKRQLRTINKKINSINKDKKIKLDRHQLFRKLRNSVAHTGYTFNMDRYTINPDDEESLFYIEDDNGTTMEAVIKNKHLIDMFTQIACVMKNSNKELDFFIKREEEREAKREKPSFKVKDDYVDTIELSNKIIDIIADSPMSNKEKLKLSTRWIFDLIKNVKVRKKEEVAKYKVASLEKTKIDYIEEK